MLTSLTILGLGLLFGVRHAADPDHVVAVTTIVSRQRSVLHAAWIGALWGLGHTATICLVGGAIILFRLAISARIALGLEFGVAMMLIVLGVLTLRGEPVRSAVSRARPVIVGFVHGLAGSAAVALMVLALIEDPIWALAYLLVFGIGTIAGMVAITLAIALPSVYAVDRFPGASRWLRVASGAASIAFGLFLAHHVGIEGGLFTGNVQWEAH